MSLAGNFHSLQHSEVPSDSLLSSREARRSGWFEYRVPTTVGHRRLWKKSPEVPVILSAAKTGARVALDGVVEVGEARRIAEEKDGVLFPTMSQFPSSV